MNYATAPLLAAITVALATACSSQSESAPTSQSPWFSPTAATPSATASPTTIPRNRAEGEPVVLHKQLGEKGAIGCPDTGDTGCDVEFAVNAIQQDAQCEDPYPALGPEEQLVRFEFEIWTAQSFQNPDVDTAFFIDNWGIGDAEGVDTNLTIQTAIRCDGELTGDQIQKLLLPGTHVVKDVIFTAPKNATTLRLYNGGAGDGWTWDIPPA